MVRSMEDEFQGILGIRYVLILMNLNYSTNFLIEKTTSSLQSFYILDCIPAVSQQIKFSQT